MNKARQLMPQLMSNDIKCSISFSIKISNSIAFVLFILMLAIFCHQQVLKNLNDNVLILG